VGRYPGGGRVLLCLSGCRHRYAVLWACCRVCWQERWRQVSPQGCVGLSLLPRPRRELLCPARWKAAGGRCVGEGQCCVFRVVVVCRWLLFTSCPASALRRWCLWPFWACWEPAAAQRCVGELGRGPELWFCGVSGTCWFSGCLEPL